VNRNIWLEKEQEFIEKEILFNKPNKCKDVKIMSKFIILIGFISLLSYANAQVTEFEYQITRTWGDTWTCPKETCGYENYEGIEYCGLCGTKRD
jgi:hypothetical protein